MICRRMPHFGTPRVTMSDTGLHSLREFRLLAYCEVCKHAFTVTRFVGDEDIAGPSSEVDAGKVSLIVGQMTRQFRAKYHFIAEASTESVS